MKFRVECFRTMKADYGEFEIEAPNRAAAWQIASDALRTSKIAKIEWIASNEVHEVGITDIVTLEDPEQIAKR